MAGYELITTASRPRTAVFRGRATAWRARPMTGSRRGPARLRTRRNRWRVLRQICLRTCPRGKGAGLVYVPAAAHVVLIRLAARAGARPGSTRSSPARKTAIPSGRTGTISSTARVRRTSWNAMKSRIHCVLTQWKPVSLRPAGVGPRTDGAAGAGGYPGAGRLKGSSLPGRFPPRRPCACPGGGSGTGRTAGLRHPGPPSRR